MTDYGWIPDVLGFFPSKILVSVPQIAAFFILRSISFSLILGFSITFGPKEFGPDNTTAFIQPHPILDFFTQFCVFYYIATLSIILKSLDISDRSRAVSCALLQLFSLGHYLLLSKTESLDYGN